MELLMIMCTSKHYTETYSYVLAKVTNHALYYLRLFALLIHTVA